MKSEIQKVAKEYALFFEHLKAGEPREKYESIFDTNAVFEDPFQKVQGLEAIVKVFEHMFATLDEPNFEVKEIICDENIAYMRWDFNFKRAHHLHTFEGVSRVVFNEALKVTSHIDYWDAAAHVYEKIPFLGAVLRFIKRKIGA